MQMNLVLLGPDQDLRVLRLGYKAGLGGKLSIFSGSVSSQKQFAKHRICFCCKFIACMNTSRNGQRIVEISMKIHGLFAAGQASFDAAPSNSFKLFVFWRRRHFLF